MTPILQAAAIATLTLGAGAATVSILNEDIPNLAVPEGDWHAGTDLDGLVFYTTDVVQETGEVLKDELHFVDGKFQSSMCQIYCDFGWTTYRTKTSGDVIKVTVETQCPDAPHTVVWLMTVDGDEVALEATWTTRRWYWTKQISVKGAGSTTPHPAESS